MFVIVLCNSFLTLCWSGQGRNERAIRICVFLFWFGGAVVAEWLSSWLAELEDRGSIPGLAT